MYLPRSGLKQRMIGTDKAISSCFYQKYTEEMNYTSKEFEPFQMLITLQAENHYVRQIFTAVAPHPL